MTLKTLKPRLTTAPDRLATMQADSWRTSAMGGTARGYGYGWQQRRKRQLERFPLCVLCAAAGRTTIATVADHIEPHRGDPAKFAGPLQSLCKRCHDSIKQTIERKSGG